MYEVGVSNKLINQSLLEYRNPESNSGRLLRMGFNNSLSGSVIGTVDFNEVDVLDEKEFCTVCDVGEENCCAVVGR